MAGAADAGTAMDAVGKTISASATTIVAPGSTVRTIAAGGNNKEGMALPLTTSEFVET
jgi:hypothetical protein